MGSICLLFHDASDRPLREVVAPAIERFAERNGRRPNAVRIPAAYHPEETLDIPGIVLIRDEKLGPQNHFIVELTWDDGLALPKLPDDLRK